MTGFGEAIEERQQELLWPARQHPDELIIPRAHPTKYPGTWVAIFDETLPKDQVNGLRVEGFDLYKQIVALPDRKLMVIIREDPIPDDAGNPDHESMKERYYQYDPTARPYAD